MIVVFGLTRVKLPFDIEHLPTSGNNQTGIHSGYQAGGRGLSQAVAAQRAGGKTILVTSLGQGVFGKELMTLIEKEKIETQYIHRSDQHTDITLSFNTPGQPETQVRTYGASKDLSTDFLPLSEIKKDHVLLIQTDLSSELTLKALESAKDKDVTTVMNLSPSIDISQKTLNLLDYLIVNMEEAHALAEQIGIKVENDALKLAEGFAKQGNLTCIVTIGEGGSVAYTNEGVGWAVDALTINQLIDKTGAEDAYSGTFSACLTMGLPLPRILKRASTAASLTCTREGGLTTFPTAEEIEERINDLDDPKQIK